MCRKAVTLMESTSYSVDSRLYKKKRDYPGQGLATLGVEFYNENFLNYFQKVKSYDVWYKYTYMQSS